jgi:outer membrane protein TolC
MAGMYKHRWFEVPVGALVAVAGLLLVVLTIGGCASMAEPVEESLPTSLPKDGIGSLDEYSAAKSRTQIARADLSIQQAAWRESIRRLNVLIGRPPQGAIPTDEDLPSVAPPPIHAPLSVMRQRPDIRAAVARVESARRLSRAADKAMLPGVTLTGELFRSATSLGNIGSSTSYWGILGSVFQPLFEGGRLMDRVVQHRSACPEGSGG